MFCLGGVILVMVVLAYVSMDMMKTNADTDAMDDKCLGARSVVTVFFLEHCFNILAAFICIFKLDIRFGNGWWIFTVMAIDIGVLVWGSVMYFAAQMDPEDCVVEDYTVPIFFWLGAEVMFYYMFTTLLVCYFFRKKCQEPIQFIPTEKTSKTDELADIEKWIEKLGPQSLSKFSTPDTKIHDALIKANWVKKFE